MRQRRRIFGISLLLGPSLLLVGNVLGTRGPVTPDAYLDAIATRPDANEASIVIATYGFLLMIVAVFAVLHLLRGRAATLGLIGGGLLLLGFVSFAFVAGTEYINIAASHPTANRAEMLDLNTRVGQSLGYNLINGTEITGYLFGTIVIAIALGRAKVTPWLISALLAVGVVTRFFGAAQWWLVLFGDTMMVAAYSYLGVKLLRATDEQRLNANPIEASPPRDLQAT